MTAPSAGWRILSARTVFDTPWICVREYDAKAPTGADARYGLVHFKNHAVGILPIEPDGTTWMVGQSRFTTGRYGWELPEGGAPEMADPFETAVRELSEEAGLKAENWMPVIENLHLSNSVTDERAFAWICWGLSECSEHAPDDVEDLAIERMPLGQAVQMAVNGDVKDAFTLAMLLKADHLWRTGSLPEDLARAFAAGQI